MGFKMKSSVKDLCSPLQSIWDNKKESVQKSRKSQEESKEAYKKKYMKNYEGSLAEKVVNTITPKTAGEAVTMVAGGGLLGNLGKIHKIYKKANTYTKIFKG